MKYIAWSDGSYLPDKQKGDRAFLSYFVEDQNGVILCDYQAEIAGAHNSGTAEKCALLALAWKLKELKLKNVEIYSDAMNVVHLVKNFNPWLEDVRGNKHVNFQKGLIKLKEDFNFFIAFQKSLQWRSRKENKAHRNFAKLQKSYPVVSTKDFMPSIVKKNPVIPKETRVFEKRCQIFLEKFGELSASRKEGVVQRKFRLSIHSSLLEICSPLLTKSDGSSKEEKEKLLTYLKEKISRGMVIISPKFQGFILKNLLVFVSAGEITRIVTFPKKMRFAIQGNTFTNSYPHLIELIVTDEKNKMAEEDRLATDLTGMNAKLCVLQEGKERQVVDKQFEKYFFPAIPSIYGEEAQVEVKTKSGKILLEGKVMSTLTQFNPTKTVEELAEVFLNKWKNSIEIEGTLGIWNVCSRYAFQKKGNRIVDILVGKSEYYHKWMEKNGFTQTKKQEVLQ